MTEANADRLARKHDQFLKEFNEIQAAVRDERMQSLSDRRFYSIPGAQWEGPLGDQFENKPRMEFNMVHLAVIRIINEYRNNRIDVDFVPKDGTTRADLADTCDGLYRADEQDSGAQEAHDNAFEESVGGGFGGARLVTEYEDEYDDDNDKQRICIKPIFDADSCLFFNLDAKRQDKADAKRAYLLTPMSHDAYKEEYNDDPSDWPKSVTLSYFDWCTPEVVYVAEIYEVEDKTEIIHVYRGLDDVDMDVPDSELKDDPDKLSTLLATGFREVRQKRRKSRKVHKYIASGSKILSDEGFIAGKCIPLIPNYGKRWVVDGVERCMGHVRLAKDAQRLFNSLMSWLTDMAGRFDIEKPIVSPEQMLGHSTQWANDNVERFSYLLLNNQKDADGNIIPNQGLAYTKAPNIPPAMAALLQIAQTALQDLLGNQEAGEQMQPNMSGKAVELIQNRLDMQVFIYMSNFAKYVKRVGEVWLSMAKDVYVEDERKMKTVAPDGSVSTATLNEPSYDAKTGKDSLANNLEDATFDVWADVGPSSTSQRAAVVRALTGIASITDDPQTKQALMLATLTNLQGEGLGDLRDWARAQAIQMGIIKPNDEEKEELAAAQAQKQNQPPDAQTQYLLAAASESQANAEESRAKTVDTLAHANLNQAQADAARAKADGTTAENEGLHPDQQIVAAKTLHDMLTPPGGVP